MSSADALLSHRDHHRGRDWAHSGGVRGLGFHRHPFDEGRGSTEACLDPLDSKPAVGRTALARA